MLNLKIGANATELQNAVPNDPIPTCIDSELFKGDILVRVKDYSKDNQDYFKGKSRLFAIEFRGIFKQSLSGDDIVFGAVFDRKISPPYGSYIGLKFANLIDPALEADLYCSEPWLKSPLLCAMNTVHVEAQGECSSNDSWPWNSKAMTENTELLNTKTKLPDSTTRRRFFKSKQARESVSFQTNTLYNFEFFGPTLNLNTFRLSLGININVQRYLNNQPIRFQASTRDGKSLFMIEFSLK